MTNRQAHIPWAMTTRKFYCHKCGTRLETKAKFRTIKRGDPDYRKYSRFMRFRTIGDIELTEYDFYCPSCKCITEFNDQRLVERAQKLAGKHTLSEEEMEENIEKAKAQLEKKEKILSIVTKTVSIIIVTLLLWRGLGSGDGSIDIKTVIRVFGITALLFQINKTTEENIITERNKTMKRIITFILILALLLCGCASKEDTANSLDVQSDMSKNESEVSSEISDDSGVTDDTSGNTSDDTSNDTSDDTSSGDNENPPVEIIPDHNENPLTGLMDLTDEAVGKRPVAIMVNNIRASLPQYGIDKADILFEMPAEGGISRFMAIYADYTQIPRVCSIRSCRKYFPAISEGFDAIYVNCGRNKVINSYLESLDLTQYDGAYDTRLFARDQDRLDAGYGREHTVYFDGPRLPEILAEDNARIDIEEDKKGNAFLFNPSGQQIAPQGTECTYVNVSFGSNKSGFTYDAEQNAYLKDFRGTPQVEGTTNQQLAFTNVIILETYIGDDPNGMHKSVDWHGGEDSVGYYLSNGKMQKIHWSKANEQSPLKLFDENGKELSINRGKTYIAITHNNYTSF